MVEPLKIVLGRGFFERPEVSPDGIYLIHVQRGEGEFNRYPSFKDKEDLDIFESMDEVVAKAIPAPQPGWTRISVDVDLSQISNRFIWIAIDRQLVVDAFVEMTGGVIHRG